MIGLFLPLLFIQEPAPSTQILVVPAPDPVFAREYEYSAIKGQTVKGVWPARSPPYRGFRVDQVSREWPWWQKPDFEVVASQARYGNRLTPAGI